MSRGFALATVLSGLLTFSDAAMSCDSARMMTTDGGFILKVVGRSNAVEAKTDRDGKESAFTLGSLTPYSVICEEEQFYRITDIRAQTVEQALTGKTGYVSKSEIHVWPTREALRIGPRAHGGDRQEVSAWDDPDALRKFLESGDARLTPPSYRENLQGSLRREPATRPYAVLASKTEKLRGVVNKRVFSVLLPATSPDAKLVIELDAPASATAAGDARTALLERLDKAMTTTTVAIAYDATASMEQLAGALAAELRAISSRVPEEIRNALRIGLVFFRDEEDDEKYLVIEPQSIANAASALAYAARGAFMKGGGDSAEPVLDAVYIAHHLFPWGDAGRKLIVAVLSDDAKPTTIGKIHDGVPPALPPEAIAADLVADGIQVVAVQDGPTAGPNLIPVLSTLGEATGGTFIGWGPASSSAQLAAALRERIIAATSDTYIQGKKDLSMVQVDHQGKVKLPFAIFDSEKLNRLRRNGLKFHVDPGREVFSKAYLIENNDLLEPVIQIDRKTMERLIELFAVIGITGGGADLIRECAAQTLAAIIGEDHDPNESAEALNRKRQGIQFRSRLLDFNIEDIAGMNRDERLAMTRRIEDAGRTLGRFLEAHAEEFDNNPSVWIPVSLLP